MDCRGGKKHGGGGVCHSLMMKRERGVPFELKKALLGIMKDDDHDKEQISVRLSGKKNLTESNPLPGCVFLIFNIVLRSYMSLNNSYNFLLLLFIYSFK